MNRHYSKREDDFIRQDYPINGAKYIADKLGRSELAINHRAVRIGVKRSKKHQFEQQSKYFMDRFDASGKPIKDIVAWKKRILGRAKFICADCGLHFPTIAVAHHIKQRYERPDLIFDLRNGVCLCPNCHALRHVKLGKQSSGARIAIEVRKQIPELIKDGYSIHQVAQVLGINIKSVYKYR